MKLERITLSNFRQYFGKQRLDFARDDERRVTIIHGANGAGKTSLFLALNWCLYGKEAAENVGELISKEATNRAEEGDLVEASVELAFLHHGERYVVRRATSANKEHDGTITLDPVEDFSMVRWRYDGQAESVVNPVWTINSILPSNARTYFFFDGEKIDNFSKPQAADEVRSAIYLVLKLEVLDRGRRHLEGAAQEYRKELKSLSGGALRQLLEKDERLRGEREKDEKRKGELVAELASAQVKIREIDQKLKDKQNARALQQRREFLEKELKRQGAELDSVVGRIRESSAASYAVIAQPAIDAALRILDEKRARGEIPSSIRHQFVEDLIAQMRCICGHELTLDSPEHHRLLALLDKSMPGSLEDDVLDTSSALRGIKERIAFQRESLGELMLRRTDLLDLLKGLEAEHAEVGLQLRGSTEEEISRLERQREGFEADTQSYSLQIGSLSERIEKSTRDILELQSQIAKAQKDEKQQRLLGAKLDLAQRTADAMGEVHERFADEMRRQIEQATKGVFRSLVWKDSHFQDIKLSAEFRLDVIDRYGMSARPELSAGERQVLSLSFITAMAQETGEEAPLVMDTPFGRLSSHHRNSITQHLPGLADQLVLFVTDEELRDQARANLKARIGAEYHLKFDRSTSCTTIEEEA